MAYRWADQCDGWAIDQQMALRFIGAEGDGFDLATTYTSWESKDSTDFAFSMRSNSTGEAEQEFRGRAVQSAGGVRTVDYRRPDADPLDLPAGTLFPTEHTLETLNRAAAGEFLFSALMFDGSDAEGLTQVDATILPAEPSAHPLAAGFAHQRWMVTLAFRTPNSQSAEPEYQMVLGMMSNGMVDSIVLDYGDFGVVGELQELALLSANC